MNTFKVHFIRCISIRNAGDMACGPYLYFPEFLDRYICTYHDMGNVDYNEINENDVVIIGASGLFEVSQEYVDAINLLLIRCKNVVAWSVGHNKHYDITVDGDIEYEKFAKLTVRDYNYPEQRYLPCVTCMIPQLSYEYLVERQVGVIEHTNFPIREFPYERISNSCAIENIIRFIGTSQVIVTNSYHCVYWATLMKKKVILYNTFSEKFKYFKYKPVIYSGNLFEDITKAQIYEYALDECRIANVDFCNEVIEYVEKCRNNGILQHNINVEYEIRQRFARLIKQILKNKKIILYGAEDSIIGFREFLTEDIEIIGISGQEEYWWVDYPILKLNEISEMDFDYILFLSWKDRVLNEKKTCGISKVKIINVYEYLAEQELILQKDYYKYFSRTWIQ